MDQYSLGDEGALPSEMHLPSFPENQALTCSDAINRDLGPGSRDLLYGGLRGLELDPSFPAPDAPSEPLEDNLDTLSLYIPRDVLHMHPLGSINIDAVFMKRVIIAQSLSLPLVCQA